MGHHVQAFVGRQETLQNICDKYGKSQVVELKRGYYLLPLIDELYDAIENVENEQNYPAEEGFMLLSAKIIKVLKDYSDTDGLVYFETDYWGGEGDQGAIAAKHGEIIYGPNREKNSINKALKQIGVTNKLLVDEFDEIGLGRYRDNEKWILQPIYSKETPRKRLISYLYEYKKLLIILCILIPVFFFTGKIGIKIFNSYLAGRELSGKAATFDGKSTELEKTVILPTLNSPMVEGKNNIWCSTFKLCWNEMKDTVAKEPIVAVGAEELSERLNNAKQTKADLQKESYYVAAGAVKDGIIEKIKTDMSAKFPEAEIYDFDPGNIFIAYSYLQSYIKFTHPYIDFDAPLTFTDSSGNTNDVKIFGIWDGYLRQYKPLCQQIEVLYSKFDEDDYASGQFALDLCKDTQPYQVVVALTEKQDSLQATYDKLQENISNFKNDSQYSIYKTFYGCDVLKVPDIFWKISHRFSELEDKILSNPAFKGLPISAAVQDICFRLDRSGAVIKSQAKYAIAAIPRMFIFDKPFLLYLKKRDANQPFFVMWIDNAELLTKFESH